VAYWQIVDKFDNNFIIHVTSSIKHDLEYVLNFFLCDRNDIQNLIIVIVAAVFFLLSDGAFISTKNLPR
jgi:hypothetical protein